MKRFKIGLIGFGTVGQAVYQMLQHSSEVNAEVVAICVKDRTKPRNLPMDRFTYDWREVIANPEVDTIIEVTSDLTEAYQLTVAALSVGKPVISANKRMLALHLSSLRDISGRTGTPLLYEASTCAGVPIIGLLENHYSALPIDSITGVFNASSQYVLSTMESGRFTYDEAVRQTQDAGWAEADPTFDMAGFDTLFKLCLLATHGFGVVVDPYTVVRFGIEGVTAADIRWAHNRGTRIKLLAHAVREGNKVALWVLPELVPADHKLHHLDGEDAGVFIEGPSFGYHLIQGKGAGGYVTGSAILADLKQLARGYSYPYYKADSGIEVISGDDLVLDILVRYEKNQQLQELPIDNVHVLEPADRQSYAKASVRLADLKAEAFRQAGVFVTSLPEDVITDVDDSHEQSTAARWWA